MKTLKIIISPAKKMELDLDGLEPAGMPLFLEEAEELKGYIQTLSYEQAKALWRCNDKLARLNFERFQDMELTQKLTPALLSYEGIQYQYMAPRVFSKKQWAYVEEHLRILSGFYGILCPRDGVVPYRLEMQARLKTAGAGDLYAYWGDRLFKVLKEEASQVVNLASKEYEKAILPRRWPKDTLITCVFGEKKNGKILQKGTLAKMARGEMVRWMAENQVEDVEALKAFTGLNYHFSREDSTENQWVFLLR